MLLLNVQVLMTLYLNTRIFFSRHAAKAKVLQGGPILHRLIPQNTRFTLGQSNQLTAA